MFESRVKICHQYNWFKAPVGFTSGRSKAVVLVLFVLSMALWLFAAGFVSTVCPVCCRILYGSCRALGYPSRGGESRLVCFSLVCGVCIVLPSWCHR